MENMAGETNDRWKKAERVKGIRFCTFYPTYSLTWDIFVRFFSVISQLKTLSSKILIYILKNHTFS